MLANTAQAQPHSASLMGIDFINARIDELTAALETIEQRLRTVGNRTFGHEPNDTPTSAPVPTSVNSATNSKLSHMSDVIDGITHELNRLSQD